MNNKPLTIFFSSLILASLACSIFIGGPEYPGDKIPASAEQVATMQAQIEQSFLAGAESGTVTIQMTESQLTSYLALKIQNQSDPPFKDPQILLQNGQMQLYGKITQGYFYATMLITMNVGIDPATGLPSITIASADFGPVDAPEGINKAISSIIDEAFTGSFGPVATGLRIETIEIADGVMTFSGRIR